MYFIIVPLTLEMNVEAKKSRWCQKFGLLQKSQQPSGAVSYTHLTLPTNREV